MSDIRGQLKVIRTDIDALLAAVAKKHGLRSLALGRCTFTPDGSFTFKLDGIADGGASKHEQLYAYALLRQTSPAFPALGTPEARIGYGGKQVELTGANSTLSKVLFRDLGNGKTYLAPRAMIEMALKAAGRK